MNDYLIIMSNFVVCRVAQSEVVEEAETVEETVLLLSIGIRPSADSILTRSGRLLCALIVALGVKIDELRHWL